MLSEEARKELHGEPYVASFERLSDARLKRLSNLFQLHPSYRALDLGCGNGIMMSVAAPQVREYVGVDFSESFIRAAERKKAELAISNATFICGDIVEFCNLEAAGFDVAFAMDFSEHVYDDEWADILDAAGRALKPGGRLYLHTPNADFFVEIMKANNFLLKQFPEHIAVRTLHENCEQLRRAGFRIEHARIIPHYNILRYLHPLSYLPLAGKWFGARIFIEANAPDAA